MDKFRHLGAAGVIGTEVPVHESLARYVAMHVLRALSTGKTLGEAFLSMRRALFRALNPLGLAYAFYASAWYHFGPSSCPRCTTFESKVSAAVRRP